MIMDPDCAICAQPALAQCDCEAKGLEIAVRQAEARMMDTHFGHIRAWVRGHAQDYILSYYEVLTTRRKEAHNSHISILTNHYARQYRSHPPPAEIARANQELKRGIDQDWQHSVQRYPEVLEYYYSLVHMNLPSDEDGAVRDPPLSALSGARKVKGAGRMGGGGGGGVIEDGGRARGRETPLSAGSRRPGRAGGGPPWGPGSQAPTSGYAYVPSGYQ